MLRETDYVDACPIATVALEVASSNEPLRIATADVFESWIARATAVFTDAGIAPAAARDLAIVLIELLEGGFMLSRASRNDRRPRRRGRGRGRLGRDCAQAVSEPMRRSTGRGAGLGSASDFAVPLLRPAEEVTLRQMATQLEQPLRLLRGLDTLGDDLEPESLAEMDDAADERLALRALAQPGDEAAVDLQLMDRQRAQIREARVAGAEVVEREAHAEVGERRQRARRPGRARRSAGSR